MRFVVSESSLSRWASIQLTKLICKFTKAIIHGTKTNDIFTLIKPNCELRITNYKSLKVLIKKISAKNCSSSNCNLFGCRNGNTVRIRPLNTKCSDDKTKRKNLIVAVISDRGREREKIFAYFWTDFSVWKKNLRHIFTRLQHSRQHCVCMWHIAN